MNIKGSVAFVTGANRGLGLAFAKALLAAGASKVYAAARDPASITLPGVQAIKLDVTNADDIAAAVKACGDVTLVINNAGIIRGGTALAQGTTENMRAEFETNVYGLLAVSKAFAPVLAANNGGVLVNVLSALSWVSFPTSIGYSASKAAAWSLTNGLRQELRAQGTQVVAVHVGYMDTDMVKDVQAPKSNPSDVANTVLQGIEAGDLEVLADAISRQVKAGLSAQPGVYLAVPA
ncbi:SDR family oxidoreductase [Pseudolysobacter antarcticus]|uniref:SDR family oxidoreductase n=1 Tax=Pseudolysobacter antarcticus TaxID=2511995 RepID=A0A411HM78_9GAMM|nr:SDR family oxidoreductase [Pseudolysobacter antarcticus]QBB71500.1 SDR family oxidoreductase [Pseudolysobacter antarcticus]